MTTREQVWIEAWKVAASTLDFPLKHGQTTFERADQVLAEFDKRFAKKEEGQKENQSGFCKDCVLLNGCKCDWYHHIVENPAASGINCQHFKPKEG